MKYPTQKEMDRANNRLNLILAIFAVGFVVLTVWAGAWA